MVKVIQTIVGRASDLLTSDVRERIQRLEREQAELRARIEDHLAHCRHCAAVLDSTRNILYLIADERTFELPAGFSERLHSRLKRELAEGSIN